MTLLMLLPAAMAGSAAVHHARWTESYGTTRDGASQWLVTVSPVVHVRRGAPEES